MVSRKLQNYKNYFHCLSRKLLRFPCPHCKDPVQPQNFEKHCTEHHNFNTKCSCVWCSGATSWMPRQKSENSVHLLKCFRKFIAPYEISAALETATAAKANPSQTTTTSTLPFDTVTFLDDPLLCIGRCFFDHDSRYIRKLPPKALDLFSVLPVEPQPLRYVNENLNLAVSCVRKYLDTRDTHDWIHIMVKAVSFRSFLKALDEDRGVVRLLPFSCWCDGGPHEKPRHRQHRHMVAVAPKGHFETHFWNKIGTPDRPCRNFPSKGEKWLKTPLHLVNTLGYLSRRTSRCQFTLQNKKRPPTKNHFYIFTTLPVHYKLPLVLLWDGGVGELLYQERFQNVSIEKVVRHPLFRVRSQWKQKIKDFHDLPADRPLPVDWDFVPTENADTPYFVYLVNGRKLHFERLEEPLDRIAWLARQAEGGNSFYRIAVGEETWTPRPRDQKILNSIMPRDNRIRDLGVENACLKRKLEASEEDCKNKQAKIDTLKEKIIELQEGEIEQLKNENTRLNNKINELNEEGLKLRVEELERENEQLKRGMDKNIISIA